MYIGASGGGASVSIQHVSVPVVASYYLGGENHKLQLGLGFTALYASGSASVGTLGGSGDGFTALPTGVIGYKYAPVDGGFMFSAGFTPLLSFAEGGGFAPWIGIGLGDVF